MELAEFKDWAVEMGHLAGWAHHANAHFEVRDTRLKRAAIEMGHLKTWRRRGRGRDRGSEMSPLKHLFKHIVAAAAPLRTWGEGNVLDHVIRHVPIEFADLPPAFDGFRILHLSDLHIDALPELASTVAGHLSRLEADLCVLTGDYRYRDEGSCHPAYEPLSQVLGAVRARHGIVGVLGNHDFMEMAAELEEMGVRMLINASRPVRKGDDELWVIGLDDPHYFGCDDLGAALRGVPDGSFRVLLVHTPEIIAEAERAGMHVYLCGHTHAGQVRMPLLGPPTYNATCARRHGRGLWRHGRMFGYTSAGVGATLVPVRFFCPPEIVLIELRRAAAQS